MNKKEFKDYNTEVMLQILRNADHQLTEAFGRGDEEKIKFIKEEIIPKYEKLFLGLAELDIRDKTDEEIEKFKNTVEKIRESNGFTKEYIERCITFKET